MTILTPDRKGITQEDVGKQVTRSEAEVRMVMPGIQALFGFQLIAVFNDGFQKIPEELRVLHGGALGMTVLAMILALTPASYHRLVEPEGVSKSFAKLTSGFLTAAMICLMLSVCADFGLIVEMICESRPHAVAFAGIVFALLVLAWFVFPLVARSRKHD